LYEVANVTLIFLSHSFLTQAPPSQEVWEGSQVTFTLDLQCQHPSISTETIHWYQQLPGHGPRFIASGYQGETRSSVLEGVSLHIPADRKSSTLSFARVTLADSALYFCALRDTVSHPAGSAVQKASPSGSRCQRNPCWGEQRPAGLILPREALLQGAELPWSLPGPGTARPEQSMCGAAAYLPVALIAAVHLLPP
uniref:Ig-like domain-containing protein n=1 Tax=Varanus komodoensis TaxID=61221 RepID=A0A8D2L8N5_VARKO